MSNKFCLSACGINSFLQKTTKQRISTALHVMNKMSAFVNVLKSPTTKKNNTNINWITKEFLDTVWLIAHKQYHERASKH